MALLAAAATACGGEGDTQVLTAAGVDREVPKDDLVPALVRGLTVFGHALYQVAAKPAENTVMSPLSIAYAFGMARAGAVGATGAALDRTFGFPAEGPHTAFNALSRKIVTVDGPPPPPERGATRDAQDSEPAAPIVGIANGLFAQEGLPVKEPFLRTLASQYGAGVRTLDFRKDPAGIINAWADEQTAGRVKKVFDRLDPDIKLVIANAIYMKADWRYHFAEGASEQNAAFTRADGSTVRTKLMRQTESLRYAEGSGWQAVELPYAKSDLAMLVLLPRPGASPADLLAPATLQKVVAGLKPQTVSLALPPWDFGTSLDLEASLRKLGLGAMFDGGDFSGIADRMTLGQAVHRANISVDEWGTEAAAVTALGFAAAGHAGRIIDVRADRPFAFAIVHSPTAAPLFVGHVADPAASG